MASKFNWRHAFYGMGGNLTTSQLNRVYESVNSWSDWEVSTSDGYIIRVEDCDGDGIWDYEWEEEDFDRFFSDRFIKYMNTTFGKPGVVIGKATKLPLPVASPPSSSKGAVSSSSF